MRRNPDFLLRDVAGTSVIVPVGAATTAFPGMITLNSTGVYIWQLLEQDRTEQSLVAAMIERYDVSETKALEDVRAFVDRLKSIGAVTED